MDFIKFLLPLILENPMGESEKDGLRVNFDGKLKVGFHEVKVVRQADVHKNRRLSLASQI